jgi:hypothetical protein
MISPAMRKILMHRHFGDKGIVAEMSSDKWNNKEIKENGATRLTIKGRLGRSVVNQYREGWTLTNVGDVNGDGIDDIASGNPAPGTPNSRVEFFSGAAIMGATSTTVVSPFSNFYTNTPNSLLGYGVNSVVGISDMDGDGKNEVALGAMGDSLVHIVRP